MTEFATVTSKNHPSEAEERPASAQVTDSPEKAGGLTDLDQVAVGVADVRADLAPMVLLCTFTCLESGTE